MADALVVEVTDANFDEKVLKSALPVLIDFWAPWCGPCRMMGPIIDEVAKTYAGKLVVAKMNVDDSPRIPAQYNVRGIPNMKFFKAGKVIDEIMGAVPKQKLEESILKVI